MIPFRSVMAGTEDSRGDLRARVMGMLNPGIPEYQGANQLPSHSSSGIVPVLSRRYVIDEEFDQRKHLVLKSAGTVYVTQWFAEFSLSVHEKAGSECLLQRCAGLSSQKGVWPLIRERQVGHPTHAKLPTTQEGLRILPLESLIPVCSDFSYWAPAEDVLRKPHLCDRYVSHTL